MTFIEWWRQTLWSQLEGSEREEAKAKQAFIAGRASMKAEAEAALRGGDVTDFKSGLRVIEELKP